MVVHARAVARLLRARRVGSLSCALTFFFRVKDVSALLSHRLGVLESEETRRGAEPGTGLGEVGQGKTEESALLGVNRETGGQLLPSEGSRRR